MRRTLAVAAVTAPLLLLTLSSVSASPCRVYDDTSFIGIPGQCGTVFRAPPPAVSAGTEEAAILLLPLLSEGSRVSSGPERPGKRCVRLNRRAMAGCSTGREKRPCE
jgi:hypothetical protein